MGPLEVMLSNNTNRWEKMVNLAVYPCLQHFLFYLDQ